jgi:hypothetical protein
MGFSFEKNFDKVISLPMVPFFIGKLFERIPLYILLLAVPLSIHPSYSLELAHSSLPSAQTVSSAHQTT